MTEERKVIHKRQKLIKIADKCKDGWQVVGNYESDEFASNSDDEKKLKKSKEATGKKQRVRDFKRYDEKRQKSTNHCFDNPLFRGRS